MVDVILAASSLIHLSLIPIAALIIHAKPIRTVNVPIELVHLPLVEEAKKPEVIPPSPPAPPKPKAMPAPKPRITAPKLLSKPEFVPTPAPFGNTKEKVKEPESLPEPPPLASLPPEPGAVKYFDIVGAPRRTRTKLRGSDRGIGNIFD